MIIEEPDLLKIWLVDVLTPICEADPDALAKYIMALIKKDKREEELKEFCIEQLEVFLTTNTKQFANDLFKTLKDKSYKKPTSNKKSPQVQQPDSSIAAKSEENSTTSRAENTIREDDRRSSKRRKSPSPRRVTDARSRKDRTTNKNTSKRHRRSRSRSPASRSPTPTRRGRRSQGPTKSKSLSRSPTPRRTRKRSASRSPVVEVKKRERCRNYHEKGMCLEGDACPFDHGSDPLVVDTLMFPGQTNPVPPPVQPAALLSNPPQQSWPEYDPRNPGVDRPPAPLLGHPQQPQWNGPPDGWNGPRAPLGMPPHPMGARPNLNIIVPESHHRHPGPRGPMGPGQMQSSVTVVPTNHSSGPSNNHHQQQHFMPMRGGRGRGRGRGGRGYGRGGNVRYDQPEKTTLELRKVPPNLNEMVTLNEYFSKFGKIVSLQVNYGGDPEAAVIQFARHQDALAAHKCEDAILGTRFVRCFWHHKEQEKVDPTPERSNQEEDTNRRQPDSTDEGSGDNSATGEEKKTPVKERLDFSAVEGIMEPPKPSRPVMDPKQLKKSNVEKTSTQPVPIQKTPQEIKKEKLLKSIELKQKTEDILKGLMDDYKVVASKVVAEKDKKERTKLTKFLSQMDSKIESTKATLEELDQTIRTIGSGHHASSRGRGRGSRGRGRGGYSGMARRESSDKKTSDGEHEAEVSVKPEVEVSQDGQSSSAIGQPELTASE